MNPRSGPWLTSVSGGAFAVAVVLVVLMPNAFADYLALVSGLICLASVLERFRYKTVEDGPPGRGWVETDERFIDPETNRRVTVFYNPSSGERRYVAAPRSPRQQP
jgi:hypothetical protein